METILRSALWAAYGDALGFVTELTDQSGLRRRAGVSIVERAVPWTRRVGGRFGVEAKFPPGAYSDDTQLRLATSRAIGTNGQFDVEAFAKVELTIWPTYALGGGRGTKAAAANLTRSTTAWFTNFFSGKRVDYMKGGGNGAAMRIQPHIWAAPGHHISPEVELGVIRNAITTHGHVRGIAGALFHAYCVAFAMVERAVPSPDVMRGFLGRLLDAPALLGSDQSLSQVWLPTWEDRSRTPFPAAMKEVVGELSAMLDAVPAKPTLDGPAGAYFRLLDSLDATEASVRGSGTRTALLAAALAWLMRDEHPQQAVVAAANAFGSDTDTIATMCGALVGAVATEPPHDRVQDSEYIHQESARLHLASTGAPVERFGYPDLLEWQPPRAQVDAVGRGGDEEKYLAGLGRIRELRPPMEARAKGDMCFQWFELSFGQKLLAKRRFELHRLSDRQLPQPPRIVGAARPPAPKPTVRKRRGRPQHQIPLFENDPSGVVEVTDPVAVFVRDAEAARFQPEVVGHHVLALLKLPGGVQQAREYVGLIARLRGVNGT